ncbi:YceK/YidQ family lipoprotein [Ursidibacter sp. B-7004-1]
MKRTGYKGAIFAFYLLNLTACGTISSLAEDDYTPYAGVIKDFQTMREGGIISVLAVVDLPLSFVFDTLLLPITLTR